MFLLKESGTIAESKSFPKINEDHVKTAMGKLDEYQKPVELDKDEEFILNLIKKNPDKITGELYELYKQEGGDKALRTFQRKINSLEKTDLIKLEEVTNIQGKAFKIKAGNRKLSEF